MENNISFTKRIKNEICSNLDLSKERKSAILSSFIKNVGIFRIKNGEFNLYIKVDNAILAKYLYSLFNSLFDTNIKFAYETTTKFGKKTYYLLIIDKNVEEMLSFLKIDIYKNNIDELFFSNEEYKYGYLIGLFLSSGNCNDPSSSNYHLEMSFDNSNFCIECQNLINSLKEFDFNIRLIKRRNKYVLYFKKSELISSFLILIGAVECCLEFENKRVERDFINVDNRILNIEGANFKKTLDSSKSQIEDIKFLDDLIGIDNLNNQKMITLAKLRLSHEEASLNELAKLLGEELGIKVSKSNVAYILNKISALASRYKGNI